MLSLTRNIDQSIMIYTSDGPIKIMVRMVSGQQFRIGIDAPQSVNIVRSEIDEKKIEARAAS
jgi:carbon storage regulator CsrA